MSNKRKGRKGKARKNIYPIDKARGKQEATLDIEIDPEFQAGARAHGAAMAHRVIAWHGEAVIAAFLLRWKGLELQAIEKLAPAFLHEGASFDPADLPPDFAGWPAPAREEAANAYMAVACFEQARGLYEALDLLLTPEDEDGDPLYEDDPTMDAIGELLADEEGGDE